MVVTFTNHIPRYKHKIIINCNVKCNVKTIRLFYLMGGGEGPGEWVAGPKKV